MDIFIDTEERDLLSQKCRCPLVGASSLLEIRGKLGGLGLPRPVTALGPVPRVPYFLKDSTANVSSSFTSKTV